MTSANILLRCGALCTLLAAAPAFAAEQVVEAPAEEPEVTIIQRNNDTIEEYRIHGQLYMIKVTPHRGVPYYLVDTNGDGNLETRRNNISQHLLIPSWTLFRW
ncbi:MAG: DUF2782 domain-containing protein [Chromatiales bacterium]|jgi:hypothetical protein|nr:DUF2782 domain-containing protein [Chromatiales bacterium]